MTCAGKHKEDMSGGSFGAFCMGLGDVPGLAE